MSRHAALHNLPRRVHSSNLFSFIHFRTQVHDRNALNPFTSIDLRATLITTEGWGLIQSSVLCSPVSTLFCVALFAPCYPLCFHANTNCPFCNSFLLITIRIARGVACPLPTAGLKFHVNSLPRRSAPFLSAHSVISVWRKHRRPHSARFPMAHPSDFRVSILGFPTSRAVADHDPLRKNSGEKHARRETSVRGVMALGGAFDQLAENGGG